MQDCICTTRGARTGTLVAISTAFVLTAGAYAGGPPANDTCAGAFPILCNEALNADNVGATDTAPAEGVPPFLAACIPGTAPPPFNAAGFSSIWYSFVATDTTAYLDTCRTWAPALVGGNATDSILAVYSGGCAALVEVACNDDQQNVAGQLACSGGPFLTGMALAGLVVNDTYHIQLATWNQAPGNQEGIYVLSLKCPETAVDPPLPTQPPPPPIVDCICDPLADVNEQVFDPLCGVGVDPNGGCNVTPNAFLVMPADCGVTGTLSICGGIGGDGTTRDTDWYQFTLTAATQVTVTGCVEDSASLFFIDATDCAAAVVVAAATAVPADPTFAGSLTACLDAGTWVFFHATSAFVPVLCQSDLDLDFVCTPCPAEACCTPDGLCADLNAIDCATAGGTPQGAGTACLTTVCTGACCLPTGLCVDAFSPDTCAAIAQTRFQGVGSVCADPLVICPVVPANDECAGRLPLAVPGKVLGDTTGAFPEADVKTCDDGVVFSLNDGPGVWYNVIGTGNTITLTTDDPLTVIDTEIVVYCDETGTCTDLVCVVANDDIDPGIITTSTVSFCSALGRVYHVVVMGFDGALANQGVFSLASSDDGILCDAPVCARCTIATPCVGNINESLIDPTCGAVDATDPDGGCHGLVADVIAVTHGDAICGSSTVNAATGDLDLDFYSITLTVETEVTITLNAEYNVQYGFLDTGGIIDCAAPPTTFLGAGGVFAGANNGCPNVVLTECLPIGEWWFIVSVAPNEPDPPTCAAPGHNYDLTVTCQPCPLGACCLPTGECIDSVTSQFCTATLGGIDFIPIDPAVPGSGECPPIGNAACPQPPVNDDCATRIDIFDGVTPYNTLLATTDGLPNVLCEQFAGNDDVNNDIWYNYKATCNGNVNITTCPGGLANPSGHDSKIAVYARIGKQDSGGETDAQFCAAIKDPLNPRAPVACNDDGADCPGFESTVNFRVLCGEEYKIRLGSFTAGVTGTGDLVVSCTPNCEGDCAAPSNGAVDVTDLLALLGAFGQGQQSTCDTNCDGFVNVTDLLLLLGQFGACP